MDDKLPRNDLGGQSNKSLTLIRWTKPRDGQSKTYVNAILKILRTRLCY